MASAVAPAKRGRPQDDLSIMIAEAIEYLEGIGHPISLSAVKEVVLDEIGTGPQIKWGPIDVQQAVKTYAGVRIRAVLIRMGYVAIEGETYERVMYSKRNKRHIRECIRYLKQLRVYDDNRIRFEEGILGLMEAHRVSTQAALPENELEVLYDSIYV